MIEEPVGVQTERNNDEKVQHGLCYHHVVLTYARNFVSSIRMLLDLEHGVAEISPRIYTNSELGRTPYIEESNFPYKLPPGLSEDENQAFRDDFRRIVLVSVSARPVTLWNGYVPLLPVSSMSRPPLNRGCTLSHKGGSSVGRGRWKLDGQ